MYQIGNAGCRVERLGAVATSKGTAVLPSTSSGVYGSAASIGTTTFDYEQVLIDMSALTQNVHVIVDLHYSTNQGHAISAVEGLYYNGYRLYTESALQVMLPLHVPTGSTLYMSAKCNGGASTSLYCAVTGFSRGLCGLPGFRRIKSFQSSPSGYTIGITGGVSGGDISGWRAINASLEESIDGILSIACNRSTTVGTCGWGSVQYGTGALGEEVPITPWMGHFVEEGNYDGPLGNNYQYANCRIEAGTRVAARCWTQNTPAGFNIMGYGMVR